MTPFGKLVVTILLAVIAGGGYFFVTYKGKGDTTIIPPSSATSTPPVATTTPDTSTSTATTTPRIAAGYITGHVIIGPNCPVEQIEKPCPTPPEAYTSRNVLVYANDKTSIQEQAHLDTKGNFYIPISPGSYYVQISPTGIGPGEKKLVTVKSFATSTVNFNIDTGIR